MCQPNCIWANEFSEHLESNVGNFAFTPNDFDDDFFRRPLVQRPPNLRLHWLTAKVNN